MAVHVQIICKGPEFLSQRDELVFFEWLGRIKGVAFEGRGRDCIFSVQPAKLSEVSLREFIALLYRFRLQMDSLAKLETQKNTAWFADPEIYWHKRVFKNPKKQRGSRDFAN